MTTNFPSSIDAFTNPTSGDTLDNPPHDQQHADINDAMEAVQTSLLDGAPLHIDDANERVGIGTASPEEELHIVKDQNGDLTQVLIENADQRVRIGSYYEAGVGQYGKIQSEQDAGGDVALALNPEGGRVGINDVSPSYTLDVDGDINATGDVRVGGNPVGMVLVKTQTIGSGVSSVTVSNAFSSTFDNYRVLVNCNTASASGPYFTLQIGSATTGYYSGRTTINYATSAVTGASENNASKWGLLGALKTGGGSMSVDLLYPYATERTFLNNFYHDPNTAGGAGSGGGMLNDGNSYTSLTVGVSSGTMTGGAIRVYGYNNG